MKPSFLTNTSSENTIFCEISFTGYNDLNKFWDSKKVTKIFEKKNVSSSNEIYEFEILYKTAQNFYIWIEKAQDVEKWAMTIYYKAEQEKELNLFIKNLLKQIK